MEYGGSLLVVATSLFALIPMLSGIFIEKIEKKSVLEELIHLTVFCAKFRTKS
jgi:hypothetical protein